MIQISEYYGSPFELWAKSFCYKNYWRVQHKLGDIDDFYCQCAVWWCECYTDYVIKKGTVASDPHLMNMFKLWVIGQTNDFSRDDFRTRDLVQYKQEPTTVNEAPLLLKLNGASKELAEVLKILIDAPAEVMEVLRQECPSTCSKTFFKKVVTYLKMDQSKSTQLAKELQAILS